MVEKYVNLADLGPEILFDGYLTKEAGKMRLV
jgi:hypothetical protein